MATKNGKSEISTRPVWFITGCSTGFGRELAKHVLERGYRTVITARNPDKVNDLAARGEALVPGPARTLRSFGKIGVALLKVTW
jgi:NAD(P)-dependent dehydrogenase (short-subunit alcohol dehydrogenase family)